MLEQLREAHPFLGNSRFVRLLPRAQQQQPSAPDKRAITDHKLQIAHDWGHLMD